MYSIGEFSTITRLPVKTLRYYHEAGILEPAHVDPGSGYRYYDEAATDRARLVKLLRELEFPIGEIRAMLDEHRQEDTDILDFLERRRAQLERGIRHQRQIKASLDTVIDLAKNNRWRSTAMNDTIQEKHIDDMLFVGKRIVGAYSDYSKIFPAVARKAGRHIQGKAIGLCYDQEYRERDADIEGGFPVKKEVRGKNLHCRVLAGGWAVTLLHKGPYDALGGTYQALFDYIQEKDYRPLSPCREVYLKGPGMIFKGNPRKYLTEVQILVDRPGD